MWNYYRGEPDNNDIRNFESFKYKTSITGEIHQIADAEIVVPLKHLSNFWKSLNVPLINCEVSLTLVWSKKCVLTHSRVVLAAQKNNLAIINPKNATFQIKDTEMSVPVVTFSKENDKKLLEQLKS